MRTSCVDKWEDKTIKSLSQFLHFNYDNGQLSKVAMKLLSISGNMDWVIKKKVGYQIYAPKQVAYECMPNIYLSCLVASMQGWSSKVIQIVSRDGDIL